MCVCVGEGERLYTASSVSEFNANDNDLSAGAGSAAAAASVVSYVDDSLQHSCTLPPVDDELQSVDTTGEPLVHSPHHFVLAAAVWNKRSQRQWPFQIPP